MDDNLHLHDQQLAPEDQEIERALRPKSIDDFKGQPQIIENLFIFIEAAIFSE